MSNTFKTLFQYEIKKQFPRRSKKDRSDVVGSLLSIFVTLAIVAMFVYFLSIIVDKYLDIKINKILDPIMRSYEVLNILYLFIIIVCVCVCLEGMRKTFTDKTDKEILLRLPVSEQSLFLSKILVLLIKMYIVSALLVLPINAIVFVALQTSWTYWLSTIVIMLVLPLIVMLFASILIIPYIKIIDYVKTRYIAIFAIFVVALILFVLAYTAFLGVVQGYLESGYIKFIFNDQFIEFMQKMLLFAYPSNAMAGIMMGQNILVSILVVVACVVVAVIAIYCITKRLYHVALFKTEKINKKYRKNTKIRKSSSMMGLIKKEFISLSREPKHIFSYLVIATIMPILAYCCYTLFESLISNMLGIKVSFALALFVILVFSVLTNTFCSTNVTREGTTLLKQKTFPIKASQLLTAKVVFCCIVSLLSVIIASVVLVVFTSLPALEGFVCMMVGIAFSICQILIATKIDLKNTRMSFTFQQVEKKSSTTMAKVIVIGLVVSMICGVGTLLLSFVANGMFVAYGVTMHSCMVYLAPVVVSLIYVGLSIWYYLYKLQKSMDNITM